MDSSEEMKPTLDRLQEMIAKGSLFELYDQMLGEVDVAKVLDKTTAAVKHIFESERATIFRVIQETQELESIAYLGNVARIIRVPINNDSLAGYSALSKSTFVLPDAYGDLSVINDSLHFDRSWDEMNNFRTRDVMCSPVLFKGKLLGVVQVINSKNNPFCETDLPVLDSVCRFVAYSLHHTRLYDELATLKCLEKEKAEFMRIIVEELRAPVATSKTLVRELQFTNIENAALLAVLSRVESRMDQLLDLAEDILQLSQVKGGRPLSEIVVCDLKSYTQVIFDKYLELGENKGLSLSLELPDSPVSVRMDKQGYNLILSNLLSNAVKYTEAGSVRVKLQLADPWAVLSVEDTGIGIPAEEIPRLFKEFFRASNARLSAVKGTGVGLTSVKDLVERFQGEIELDSVKNEGSRFTVRLPLYKHAKLS